MQLAEELTICVSNAHHEKFTYYSLALQEIHQGLRQPKKHFIADFLALFSDSNYRKVIQFLAKIDKSLREPHSAVRVVYGSAPLIWLKTPAPLNIFSFSVYWLFLSNKVVRSASFIVVIVTFSTG